VGKFLAFGEVMLRLSPPGRELLLQTPKLDVWVAGAEANVVTALAKLGHQACLATMVPENELGRAAIAALRGHGVDTAAVQLGGERMGLCFVTSGAGLRPTEILYDRSHSSFSEAPASTWDWNAILADVDWFHLSGITPALGPVAAQNAIAAITTAAARGITISFDGNYRAKLWQRWDSNPRALLTQLVKHADLLFGNRRDIALLLERDFVATGEDRCREAAEAAFAAFPKLKMIASTARHSESVDALRISARIDMREQDVKTEEVRLTGVVDRIGTGDAFASGVIHALRCRGDISVAAKIGLALMALKHSLPGDASLFRQTDIDAYIAGTLDVRR